MWWSRVRVRPHKMSGRWLACFRAAQVWVAARSDAPCVCMCARGRGNALFEHVFRSCGCHRAAAGLTSSSKDCTASFYIVAEQGIGSRGHALAVGPSHCDYWLQFTNFRTFGIAIDDPELLRGRTVAQNIALLALSNCAERGVGRRWRVVTLGPLMISWSWAPFVWTVFNVIHM